MKKIAIIGAGLQAQRRAAAITNDPDYVISWVIDIVPERAKRLAKQTGGQWAVDWRKAVHDPSVDIILVLTYPDSHADISIAAMEQGKDVLCEKPLARTAKEGESMIATAKKTKRILKCGFNHRHHPAIWEAYQLFEKGLIGKPIFGRGRYGIVGRKGLENEWRSDPKIVSGGQLMEQGIHLIDLFSWFLGDIKKVGGLVNTAYWPIKPLEDNGFVIMQNKHGVIASAHSSLTQWINLFDFEVYGKKGSLAVEGLGGGYGVEKLIISKHDPNGPFSKQIIEYRGPDVSWKEEWNEFITAVKTRKQPIGNGADGLTAIKIVNAVYKASKTGCFITL